MNPVPLLVPALTIALLAALESLLSATVADNITKEKHNHLIPWQLLPMPIRHAEVLANATQHRHFGHITDQYEITKHNQFALLHL
jgi:hypothetical protein